jgi:hypothetical protein
MKIAARKCCRYVQLQHWDNSDRALKIIWKVLCLKRRDLRFGGIVSMLGKQRNNTKGLYFVCVTYSKKKLI